MFSIFYRRCSMQCAKQKIERCGSNFNIVGICEKHFVCIPGSPNISIRYLLSKNYVVIFQSRCKHYDNIGRGTIE